MKNVIFTYDTIQNGERGEACATILVDDAQAGHFKPLSAARTTPRPVISCENAESAFVGAASTSAAVGMLRTASRA